MNVQTAIEQPLAHPHMRPRGNHLDRGAFRRHRRKLNTALLTAGLVCGLALIAVIPHVFSETTSPQMEQYVEVTVLPGETLWQIAGEYKTDRMDTRRMVDRIRTANDLTNAAVYPGQVLRVPITGR